MEDYKRKNTENLDKFLEAQEKLESLRKEFNMAGVRRVDYEEVQHQNDSLRREVMLLRVGMNTFRELYSVTNLQLKHFKINEQRNSDELDLYKRAIKELQGESNQNSLIGKLYYTVLVSRWRESLIVRNYGELIYDFGKQREENLNLEKDNELLTKNLNQINKAHHNIVIENIKLANKIENLENGIMEGNFDNNKQINPLEEMKKLVAMLKEDKKENTEKLIMLKKKVLLLENEKNNLESKIEFCENLKNNIKFNNRDDFSKKLINLSEELSNTKLQNNILKRENNFEKENSNHLQRLNDELTMNLKDYEIQTTEWEKKYTKMEELFRKKDEERQKKILEALEKMKLYDSKDVNSLLKGKPLYDNKDISNVKTLYNNSEPFRAQEGTNQEERIRELNRIIENKEQEIQRLLKINEDNTKFIGEGEGYLRSNPY